MKNNLQTRLSSLYPRRLAGGGVALLSLLATPPLFAGDGDVLFVRRIAPVFQEKCHPCHGGDEAKRKGGLDMRTAASLMQGGDSEKPAVVPGRPAESPLYLAVTRGHAEWEAMPPKEADRLSAEQIGWISGWIAGGAPWPEDARVKAIAAANEEKWAAEDGAAVATSGGLSAEWTNRRYKPEGLWAYQPVRKPATTHDGAAAIDELLARRMPEGVTPAPAADARTFIRRATFDLTGLPPTPEEVESFVKNPDVPTLIDRLLASPHYGERMAQHWLDVTRYADSAGFANDYERGSAWRYRDYVVRSFNRDKPYDRFIREQIAGDEIDPDNPELLVATGFLRMGPWELTGMEVPRVARQRFLDDVTNAVGETFLAHSLQCARCHDHKFDPIPTRDYYAIQAVFAATQLAERDAAFLPQENTAGFDEKRHLEARFADHLEVLRELDRKALANADAWFAEKRLDRAPWDRALASARGRAGTSAGTRGRDHTGVFESARTHMARQRAPEDSYPPKFVGFGPDEFGRERVARKGLERLRWELDRYEPFALSVYNGRTPDVNAVLAPVRVPADRMTKGELEETCIRIGGDPFAAGPKVAPGVLSVLGASPPARIPDSVEGRRLAFAGWIASPDNPLATRTIVNRIWMWHFGRPITGNPNNFGSTGKRPAHPELLDWLSATFVEGGWSFKAMHRLIMTSDAYRRGPLHPDPRALREKDPDGASHAVFAPRRLTAEELRDAMLAATGELNPAVGGIPGRPEINLEAALQPRMVMGTFASAWVPNPLPSQRHRRSLYALRLRGLADPLLEVFNSPSPDFSCESRSTSTVTPQVFSLFNGRDSHARALALANRAVTETRGDEAAIARCFQLAYGRPPGAEESRDCLAHWRAIEGMIGAGAPRRQTPPLEVRREAVEENTGEKFTFQERLHGYAGFVPDLQPADVPPRTRALADVCLALFNSNEFIYAY